MAAGIFSQFERRIARTWARPSWLNILVALPWAIGLAFLLYASRAERLIAERQKTTYGVVTSHEPANHDRYGYVFSINGQTYHGWEIPTKTEFEMGQQVVVYYDPIEPATNALTDLYEMSLGELGPVPLLVFGIGAVAIFIFLRRRKKNRFD